VEGGIISGAVMSFFHFYLRNRKAIIPTVVMTGDGFYMDVEPVSIVPADKPDELMPALTDALGRGNDTVDTPDRTDEPGSPVLDKVGIKRWEAFERQSVLYTVHVSDQAIDLYVTGRGADGMWERRAENHRSFPLGTANEDVVEAIYEDM